MTRRGRGSMSMGTLYAGRAENLDIDEPLHLNRHKYPDNQEDEMLLQEIIAGRNKKLAKTTDEFWCLYNLPKLHFFPRYTNSWNADMQTFFGADELGDDPTWDELKPIRKKIERVATLKYDNPNGHGWFLVTPGVVNFDVSRFSNTQSRRRNTPQDRSHEARNGEVPILMSELTFKRIIDMVKVLRTLVKVKPETAKYKIIGDDRARGQTVEQVINGSAAKYDQTRVFKSGELRELVMFHGTSAKRAEKMLQTGLRPNQRGSTYYDLIPGFSEHNVYLASSPGIAANYSTREAVNDGSDAVIIEVMLTPMQVMKLLPDEDSISWFEYLPKEYRERLHRKYPMLAEIWQGSKSFNTHIRNIHHEEKRFNLSWLFDEDDSWREKDEFKPHAQKILKKYGYTRDTIEPLEKALYIDVVNTFIDALKVKSLKANGLAAYPGAIPAKQLKLIKSWSLKGSKIKPDAPSDEYNAASEKQEKTLKYH